MSIGPTLLGCGREPWEALGSSRRNAKWLLPALCASALGSPAIPSTLGSVSVAHVGAGVAGDPVTARAEEPELRSLRANFGDIAGQEVGHLVNGCAASESLP